MLVLLVFLLFSFVSSDRMYDKSINMFSPQGKLLQVDYAEIASNKGTPAIAIAGTNGDILILTRTGSNDCFLDRKINDKVERIDDDIWACYSGLAGDSRAVVRVAREYAAEIRSSLGISPAVVSIAKKVGDFQHEATLAGDRRPLGTHILLLGFASGAPVIFSVAPSGLVTQWRAIAIGQNSDKLSQALESLGEMILLTETTAVVKTAYDALANVRLNDDGDANGESAENSITEEFAAATKVDVSSEFRGSCDMYMIRKVGTQESKIVKHTNITSVHQLLDILKSDQNLVTGIISDTI